MDGVDFGVIDVDGKQWLAEGHQALLPVDTMKIVGKHNVANALASLALGSAMGLPMTAMLTALQNYQGLPHRCRLVKEHNSIRWFNDSKATNVGACLAAIDGLSGNGKIILIAGGVGKDQDFTELTQTIKNHVRAVVLIGHDADLIAKAVPTNIKKINAVSMADAVNKAAELAQTGDNVLLSPACASFDMFSGYAQRGEVFEQAVMELLK